MEAKIKALEEQKKSGKMLSDKQKILKYAMEKKHFFLPEVIKDLKILHKTATGRLSDLEDIGVLTKSNRLKTKYSGKYSCYTYISSPIKQIQLAHERKMKKFNQWMKKGKNDFSELITKTTFEQLTS